MRAAPFRGLTLALLAVVLATGCAARDPKREAAALLARSQALIDAGNSAYRAKDYATAAKRYAAASVVNHDDPAAWFGLGMALSKLGRDDDARTAYARARAVAEAARVGAPPDPSH